MTIIQLDTIAFPLLRTRLNLRSVSVQTGLLLAWLGWKLAGGPAAA